MHASGKIYAILNGYSFEHSHVCILLIDLKLLHQKAVSFGVPILSFMLAYLGTKPNVLVPFYHKFTGRGKKKVQAVK